MRANGICQPKPVSDIHGREEEIVALAKLGLGHRTICKRLGLKSELPCRKLLRTHGIRNTNTGCTPADELHWGVADIEADVRHWSKYDRSIRAHHRRTAMDHYYANHETNKKRQAETAKARHHRIKNEPWFKAKSFARNQLSRIARQARGYAKHCRTHEALGCTYQEAADHITAQLPDGWNWANYGKIWEIDHRIQLSDGLLTDPQHIARVCHFTNLRPMAVTQNRTRPKGAMAFLQNG